MRWLRLHGMLRPGSVTRNNGQYRTLMGHIPHQDALNRCMVGWFIWKGAKGEAVHRASSSRDVSISAIVQGKLLGDEHRARQVSEAVSDTLRKIL
jgi:hypothetical protein